MYHNWFVRIILCSVIWLGGTAASWAAPSISGINPTAGGPGTQVTITGAGFKPTGGATATVLFGNGATANVQTHTANQIVAVVPTNAITGPITVTISGTGGGQVNTGTFTTTPRITSFTPGFGGPSAAVDIFGANFSAVAANNSVKFGGVAATAVQVSSTTQLRAFVPSGAKSGPITVTTSGLIGTSTDSFIVSGAGPIITDFSPSPAPVGTQIQIFGGDFSGSPAVSAVKFNGVNATFTVTSGTQINAFVPAAATSGSITVTKGVNIATSSVPFVVSGKAPLITGFSPISGKAGDQVVIEGLNFTLVTGVGFGTTNASFGVSSDTQITAIVPVGAKTGKISLTNSAGTALTVSNFVVGPLIDGFSPPSGPVGAQVTITGFGLLDANKVLFGASNANFTILSGNQINATVPAGAQSAPIRVESPSGTNTTSSNFVVTALAPIVTDFTPANGSFGTTVILTGDNFGGVTSVDFNGTNANFTVSSTTQITATVPDGATTGPITVSNAAGGFTTVAKFFLPPRITGFSPTNGVVSTVIVVTGTNFTDVSKVEFPALNLGTDEAPFVINSPNQLTITIPTNAITGPFKITTPGGVIIASSNTLVQPRILSFSPLQAPVGSLVTIIGNTFNNVVVDGVKFNGTSGPFTNNSSEMITMRVPAGATTGPITVTTPDGTATSPIPFTVTVPTDLQVKETNSPTVAEFPGTVTFTITVTNVGPSIATGVKATNTLAAGLTFVSATTSQGTFQLIGNQVIFDMGVVSNKASVTATITVNATTTPGQFENRVTVGSIEGDPSLSNNTASHSFYVLTTAQRTLAIRKVDAIPNVEISWPFTESINFTLQATTELRNTNTPWAAEGTVPSRVTNNNAVFNVVTNDASSGQRFYRLRLNQ